MTRRCPLVAPIPTYGAGVNRLPGTRHLYDAIRWRVGVPNCNRTFIAAGNLPARYSELSVAAAKAAGRVTP